MQLGTRSTRHEKGSRASDALWIAAVALWIFTLPGAAYAGTKCGSIVRDAGDMVAVRSLLEKQCPCGNFDALSEATERGAYKKCVKVVIAQAATSDMIRKVCGGSVKATVAHAICGIPRGLKTVCMETNRKNGAIKCTIKSAGKCESSKTTVRHACQQESCVAASDTGDGPIDGLGGVGECAPIPGMCGDGVVNPGEICDDGTAVCVGVATSAACMRDTDCESGRCGRVGNRDDAADRCRSDCTPPHCGDAILDAFEECDDGNTVGGDGCSEACTLE